MHRVLIIDDNKAIHEDFRKILVPRQGSSALQSAKSALFGAAEPPASAPAAGFEVESAFQGQAGLEKLEQAMREDRPFSVAFVDMRMPPGWDGLQTIERLWGVDPHLQVVVCSAYSDHTWDEITRRLGLTDRLLILKKPFDPVEVLQIATALSEKWELRRKASLKFEELEALVAKRTADLAFAAKHDALTGLPGRVYLRAQLEKAVADFKARGTRFAIIFLDFDRFKIVNDSLGHSSGDDLLKEVARRMEAALRELPPALTSLVCRLGGDEFVVLLCGDQAEAESMPVSSKLLDRLAEPYEVDGYTISTTASVGITTSALNYSTPDEALRDADTAMYRAKAAGKARCVVFDHRMHQSMKERLALESDLRGVTERGELMLHYQPIVDVESGDLRCFEALLRWNHPTRGMVPPTEFIPIAEESGMIHRITLWVLNAACRQVADWRRRYPHLRDLSVSVNASAKQLTTPNIVRDVHQALRWSGLPAWALQLEVTETAIIEDPESAITVLKELSDMGVRLYMDDFGTGYTSFSYLHKLPLHAIKLDRAFMRSVTERRDYAAVVNGIVTLAHNLGIKVVAEGVETRDQVAMLLAIECDYAQGYLYGEPVPPEACEPLLRIGTRRAA
jgi:diguanylate cyclase (GGDEF)-like protein